MPRNTRAAARAQEAEAEINILNDDTATDSPDHTFESDEDQERPALAEMTSNTVQEVEVAIEALNEKDDGKNGKGTKRGRGTKKGAAKGTKKGRQFKQQQDQYNINNSEDVPNTGASTSSPFQGSSPTPSENEASDSGREEEITETTHVEKIVEEVEEIVPVEHALGNQKATNSSPVAQAPVESTQDMNASSSPSTEAVQQLQSLFEKPQEPINEPVSALVQAASTPLPASPVKSATPASKSKSTRTPSTKPVESAKSTKSGTQNKRPGSLMHGKTTHETAAKAPVAKAPSQTSTSSTRLSTLGRRPSKVPAAPVDNATLNKSKPKQRSSIAALHTLPRLAKSTKAPTKPTFSLPSEALREKLKMQKEERQKRQEEVAARMAEKKQTSSVSIKPVCKPSNEQKADVVAPVNNTIRKSLTGSVRSADKPKPAVKPAVLDAQKRASTLVNRTRPSIAHAAEGKAEQNPVHKRKSSAPVVRENRAATLRRTGSISKPMPTVPRVAEKKPEPKAEIKAETKKDEKPFDKAAAAKKARADAAERGRAASREWAEKKKRELEAKKSAVRRESEEGGKENVPPAVAAGA